MELSEMLFKGSITLFFAVVFVVCFLAFGGVKVFQTTYFVDTFHSFDFQIHTIDVENGDAFLLRLPQNKTMLIDCGERTYEDRVTSYITQYLHSEQLNTIDYFVLTHTDSDHIGNAEAIIEKFNVKNLYRPKVYAVDERDYTTTNGLFNTSLSDEYNDAICAAYQKGCNIIFSESDLQIALPNCTIKFLSPTENSYSKDNNYSAVLMIEYFSNKFLFMGDAEHEIENLLIAKYGTQLKADVLKLAHHGSKTSTTEEFLNVVQPTYAILSCSESSTILPNNEVIARVEAAGCEILSTASKGNFAITLKQNCIVWQAEQQLFNYWAIILGILIVVDLVLWKLPLLNKKAKQKT
ncbi:MAG: MBL fold metallo-hydrolase [Clostridia bacterium]|nr:MBL fold metallo-hydrolase [Clostridia bacterium]